MALRDWMRLEEGEGLRGVPEDRKAAKLEIIDGKKAREVRGEIRVLEKQQNATKAWRIVGLWMQSGCMHTAKSA